MVTNAVHGYEPEIAFYRIITLSASLLGNDKTDTLLEKGKVGINLGFISDWKKELEKRENIVRNSSAELQPMITDSVREQKRKIFPIIAYSIASILTQRNMEPGTAFAEKGNIASTSDEGSQIRLAKDSLEMLSSKVTHLLDEFNTLSKTEGGISKRDLLKIITQQRGQLQSELRGEAFQTQSLSIELYSGLIEELKTEKPETKQDFENLIQNTIEKKLVDSITSQILNMFHYPYIPQTIDEEEMKQLIEKKEYRSQNSFRTNDVGSLAVQISDLLGAIYETFPNLKGIEGSSRDIPLHKVISRSIVEKMVKDYGWEQAISDWHAASTDVDKSKLTPAGHLFNTVYDIFNSVDKYHGLFDDVNESARFSSEASSEARGKSGSGIDYLSGEDSAEVVLGSGTGSRKRLSFSDDRKKLQQQSIMVSGISDEDFMKELARRMGGDLAKTDLLEAVQEEIKGNQILDKKKLISELQKMHNEFLALRKDGFTKDDSDFKEAIYGVLTSTRNFLESFHSMNKNHYPEIIKATIEKIKTLPEVKMKDCELIVIDQFRSEHSLSRSEQREGAIR